jgi:hypothetical protein
MVCAHCGSESHRTGYCGCANYCTLCKEPEHRQKRAGCKFRVCNKCGASGHSAAECNQTGCSECGSTTHKALRASRVLNTSAPIAKARSNRRATTETTVLDWKPRCVTNAAKPATARTNAPFVHATHVAFELTNYQSAICVPNTCAPYVTAKKNQKVTTTLSAHVLSAKHASFSAT